MPIITRSKTRSKQPSDMLTSPSDGAVNCPKNIVGFRQG